MMSGRLPQVIREYVQSTRVDSRGWTVTNTGRRVLIGGIQDYIQADRLNEYLTGRGYVATVATWDKKRTSWVVVTAPSLISALPAGCVGSHPGS